MPQKKPSCRLSLSINLNLCLYPCLIFNLLILSSCHKDEPCVSCPPSGADTTSHDFTWHFDTLGDGSSSLFDVAIINDSLAYAVGEIYVNDSAGQLDPIPYSIAKWNGSKWAIQRLYYSGNNIVSPVRGVWVVSATDVWLAGGSIFHWDGLSQQAQMSFSRLTLSDPNATLEKLWGSSAQNIYGVGDAGTVVFYNGQSWQKLESGTTVDIQGLWGEGNEIIAVASRKASVPQAKKLLRISGATVSSVPDTGLAMSISSVWFTAGSPYYVVGDGVFVTGTLGSNWTLESGHPLLYKGAIRGNSRNDVFIAGAYGLISHFNGSTWKHYVGNEVPSWYANYYAVSVKGNLVMAVGWKDDQAVIVIGRRGQ